MITAEMMHTKFQRRSSTDATVAPISRNRLNNYAKHKVQLTFALVVVQRRVQIDLHRAGTGERRLIATATARRTSRIVTHGQQI